MQAYNRTIPVDCYLVRQNVGRNRGNSRILDLYWILETSGTVAVQGLQTATTESKKKDNNH